jgi:hypothetical protein
MLWSTQGDQIPDSTGKSLGTEFSTLSFPFVEEHVHKTGKPRESKFVLLLDNCNAYCHEFELQGANVCSLSPSICDTFIHCLDQGVVQYMK